MFKNLFLNHYDKSASAFKKAGKKKGFQFLHGYFTKND